MKTKKMVSVLEEVKNNIEYEGCGDINTEKALKAIDSAIEAVHQNKKLQKKVDKLKSKV